MNKIIFTNANEHNKAEFGPFYSIKIEGPRLIVAEKIQIAELDQKSYCWILQDGRKFSNILIE